MNAENCNSGNAIEDQQMSGEGNPRHNRDVNPEDEGKTIRRVQPARNQTAKSRVKKIKITKIGSKSLKKYVQVQNVLHQMDSIETSEPVAVEVTAEVISDEGVSEKVEWKGKYDECFRELNSKLEELRDEKAKGQTTIDKYRKLKEKYKNLRREHKKCSSTEDIELTPGSGIFIKKSSIDTAKAVSPSVTFFARNLCRQIFTPEELIGHSLFARSSSINKEKQVLPAVDHVRRDAIIKFSLKAFDIEDEPTSKEKRKFYQMNKRAVTKSLSAFLYELNSQHSKSMA